jgi:biopolymer transport protein ExbB
MIEVLRSGGPIMIPLAICSVLALAVIVERFWNLREDKILPPSEVEHLRGLIDRGEFERAEEYAASRPSPLNNILLPALENRRESREFVRQVVHDAGRQEVPGLERYLGILGTIASIAPLLGLLGTVLGMIQVFAVVSQQGVGQADALAGGIAQAMITTATGLAIAIPALAAYNYYVGKAEGMVLEMERIVLAMIKLILQRREAAAAAHPASASEG